MPPGLDDLSLVMPLLLLWMLYYWSYCLVPVVVPLFVVPLLVVPLLVLLLLVVILVVHLFLVVALD